MTWKKSIWFATFSIFNETIQWDKPETNYFIHGQECFFVKYLHVMNDINRYLEGQTPKKYENF